MDTIGVNIVFSDVVIDKIRRLDGSVVDMTADITCLDMQYIAGRETATSKIYIVDTLHSMMSTTVTAVVSLPIVNSLKMYESTTVNSNLSVLVRDIKVFRIVRDTYKQVTTYPLTNQPRRHLAFTEGTLKGYRTEEMMLMATAQVYSTVEDIYTKRLKLSSHKSDIFIIGGPLWSPNYVAQLVHKYLVLPGKKSAALTIPTSSFALSYNYTKEYRFLSLNHSSAIIILGTGTQVITYSTAVKHTKIIELLYNSGSITQLDGSQALEYNIKTKNNRFKLISDRAFTSIIEPLTGSFNINYGGENTFYSLNGLFNYFRYRHQDIMNTTYHILISKKLINMYTSNMVCIESHRAGYKRITVTADFLKDFDGFWLSKKSLSFIYYEDKLTLFSRTDQKLYTYDFDNILLSTKIYYNLDSNLPPSKVCLFLDPVYNMPYIMPYSSEGGQRITESGEFWNFIQINNLKLIDNFTTIEEAELNYKHELFTPTNNYVDNIVARYKDIFILEGFKGNTERVISSIDLKTPDNMKEIIVYNGSKIIYANYPVMYYSEYSKTFTSTSVYDKLVKLNLESMDFEVTKLRHYSYSIVSDTYRWHMYKSADNDAYYLFREDMPEKIINLTMYLALNDRDILEFMVFNTSTVYFITSDRKVYSLDTLTMVVTIITTIATPIIFVKFNSLIGCVLTRNSTYMYFEELQPISWTNTPSNWHTPYDMRKGELLLPYELYKSILHKRTAPIVSQLNVNITERISDKYIELERGFVEKITAPVSDAIVYPVRVGACQQSVYSQMQRSGVNPQTFSFGQAEYSKELEVVSSLNEDETFSLHINTLPIPETMPQGFKVYDK